jgi:hypothetical protein
MYNSLPEILKLFGGHATTRFFGSGEILFKIADAMAKFFSFNKNFSLDSERQREVPRGKKLSIQQSSTNFIKKDNRCKALMVNCLNL